MGQDKNAALSRAPAPAKRAATRRFIMRPMFWLDAPQAADAATARPRPDLPIATGNFRNLRRRHLLYVDKTRRIFDLVQPKNQFVFLARPRRFALLVSTLEALFQGKRALFAGTWIQDRARDWTPHCVIRLDMSAWRAESAEALEAKLAYHMAELYAACGELAPPSGMRADQALGILIQRLAARQPVVILIDEYDAPILQHLDNQTELTGIRDVLRGFYGALKAREEDLQFVFLTGVTRFARTSVLSGLNNLNDISHEPAFSDLLGFTDAELDTALMPYIEAMAQARHTSPAAVRQGLRQWYDGYLFAEDGVRVYNPYSTLHCLDKRRFANHWADSGTPVFLTRLIKQHRKRVRELAGQDARDISTTYYDWEHPDLQAIMFQTGYLTLQPVPEAGKHVTVFPNREVAQTFLTSLLTAYAQEPSAARAALEALATALQAGDYAAFVAQFNTLLALIPYEIHIRRHEYYQSLLHLTFTLMGFRTGSEIRTNQARMDTVAEWPDKVVILEYELDGTAEEALQQIEAKGYHRPYAQDGRPVIGLGVNFDRAQRRITEWRSHAYPAA